jgi:NYN domain
LSSPSLERSLPRRRVAVFIDYQNCYSCARQAFHDPGDPSHIGSVSPRRLASLLAGKGGSSSFDLTYVGVYCGLADSTKDPKTFAARRRQIAAWQKEGIEVHTRTLQYLQGFAPREKGVDVKLAIDALMTVLEGNCDVAILATCDTDLNPVIDALLELKRLQRSRASVEVIAWKGRQQNLGRPPEVPFRWIGDRDYRAIQDPVDYNRP